MTSSIPQTFSNMSEHYKSLLESGQLSDVVLVVGTKEIDAHKCILSARSPVFWNMFTNGFTKELQENRVQIMNMSLKVLQLLVRYIYTGKVETEDLCVNAAELLLAADKYQLDCLKSICEQQLSEMLATDSVSEQLIFADKHQARELIAKCLDYITDNGTHVMATNGWKKVLARPDLVIKVFERFNSKVIKFNEKNKNLYKDISKLESEIKEQQVLRRIQEDEDEEHDDDMGFGFYD